ncbi:septum formation family protein [Leifsonia sp. NPDC077715]|uniref:septum formation family protein n=1 Tax=Leifsonia sp. NPDC077715 TaxID=3155539 RepID=UPI00342F1EAE
MNDDRGGASADVSPDAEPSGLSRRGWGVLAAITVAAMVGLGVVGAVAVGTAFGGSVPDASPAHAPAIPRASARPAPLGLPPRPTPTQVATVPSQPVDTLQPGDCLQVYPSKWADAYPVVDCSAKHIAQLTSKGVLPESPDAPFPGTKALDAQVGDLCAAPGLNWHWVAIWGEDVMTDLRYPATAAAWDSGDRRYDCFVYTYSRHELTGSAMPGSAASDG